MQELLQTGAFKVKAVTRDVSKPAAQRLQERGAEVVQADLDDPNSLQEVAAFKFFWLWTTQLHLTLEHISAVCMLW